MKISSTHHKTKTGIIKRNPIRNDIRKNLPYNISERIISDWIDRDEKNENITQGIYDVPTWYVKSWLDAEYKPSFKKGRLQLY